MLNRIWSGRTKWDGQASQGCVYSHSSVVQLASPTLIL